MLIWIQCRCWFIWRTPATRRNSLEMPLSQKLSCKRFINVHNLYEQGYSITVFMGSCASRFLCKVGLDIYIYSYSFFHLLMLTCQLLMSTCQKSIITITSAIYWFYRVLMFINSIYLSIWHLTYRHQYLISRYSFLTSRQNDLADKLT